MMGFTLKMMGLVLKMMNLVLKTMDLQIVPPGPPQKQGGFPTPGSGYSQLQVSH